MEYNQIQVDRIRKYEDVYDRAVDVMMAFAAIWEYEDYPEEATERNPASQDIPGLNISGETDLMETIKAYRAMKPKIDELIAYYENGVWRQDYLDDEEGLIPQDLKRGILSEDAIYDLIVDVERVEKTYRGRKLCQ